MEGCRTSVIYVLDWSLSRLPLPGSGTPSPPPSPSSPPPSPAPGCSGSSVPTGLCKTYSDWKIHSIYTFFRTKKKYMNFLNIFTSTNFKLLYSSSNNWESYTPRLVAIGSWHAAIISDVKCTVDSMDVHSVDMEWACAAWRVRNMDMPGVGFHNTWLFFSDKKFISCPLK